MSILDNLLQSGLQALHPEYFQKKFENSDNWLKINLRVMENPGLFLEFSPKNSHLLATLYEVVLLCRPLSSFFGIGWQFLKWSKL